MSLTIEAYTELSMQDKQNVSRDELQRLLHDHVSSNARTREPSEQICYVITQSVEGAIEKTLGRFDRVMDAKLERFARTEKAAVVEAIAHDNEVLWKVIEEQRKSIERLIKVIAITDSSNIACSYLEVMEVPGDDNGSDIEP